MSSQETAQDEQLRTLQRKSIFFFNSGEKVHVKYKQGYWKRGIINEVAPDFFMLSEVLDGRIPVFYMEIIDIEKFTHDEKKVNKIEVGE